ncbi:MAG: helix-turn-helix domain-containing protein [Bacteroidia bacterium]
MKRENEKTKPIKKEKTASASDFEKLGKRMRELRIRKGYKSFETFAYENDLPRVLYGNYEQGIGNITYKNLIKIIKALDVSVAEFFSEGFN